MADEREEPASWQLMEFVAARVRLIVGGAEYYTALGSGTIVTDDTVIPEDHQGPATVVVIDGIVPTSSSARHLTSSVELSVEYYVPRDDDPNSRRLVHRARRDLVKALTFHDRELPRCVTSFELTGSTMGDFESSQGAPFVLAQVTARAVLSEL